MAAPGYAAPPPMAAGAVPAGPPPASSASDDAAALARLNAAMAGASVSSPSGPPVARTSGPPRGNPTLVPAASFEPEKDAALLRTAMKGLGTDEATLVAIIGQRSLSQRQAIRRTFKVMVGKELVDELDGETSGNLHRLLLALFRTPAERDAYYLRKAMKGLGTDEGCLTEILATRNNEELKEIKRQYQVMYGDLERDLGIELSGHFKRFCIALLQCNRDPYDTPIDRDKARADAKKLYDAGEARWGTDESAFNAVFVPRSLPQLRVTFEEYDAISKRGIVGAIESEMSGDLKKGFLALVKLVRDPTSYFADRLYSSMKGLGTDDNKLCRVVVSRCEIDMVEIKEAFLRSYGKSLAQFIKGDTSGNYRTLLLSLIGETA